MKKIITVLILNLLVNIPAQAGTVGMSGLWDFDGEMIVTDPTGSTISYSTVSGGFDFNTGTVSLEEPYGLFFGLPWTAEGTIEDLQDGTYAGHFESSWSSYIYNWDILWDITQLGNTASVVTLDPDGDGIPGTTMIDGTYAGFSFAIDGTLTAVPVPAAVWLFSSGLIALIGVSRRRNI